MRSKQFWVQYKIHISPDVRTDTWQFRCCYKTFLITPNLLSDPRAVMIQTLFLVSRKKMSRTANFKQWKQLIVYTQWDM
jgi:hypothetical protein